MRLQQIRRPGLLFDFDRNGEGIGNEVFSQEKLPSVMVRFPTIEETKRKQRGNNEEPNLLGALALSHPHRHKVDMMALGADSFDLVRIERRSVPTPLSV